MATNLHIDPQLLEEAKSLGGHKTKRDTVEAALRQYVKGHKRHQIVEEFGRFDFDSDYDYKEEREVLTS